LSVEYSLDSRPSAAAYIALLTSAGIAHRRPVDQPALIQTAIDSAQVLVTAWDASALVGALRAITDFTLHCYVCELAVVPSHQGGGIGVELQTRLRTQLGPECKVRLSSTPDAATYYPRIGYEPVELVWELKPGARLG
jgi:GNAT superfamily N-acetyltransferase